MHDFKHPQLATIHGQVVTEGARAAVVFADRVAVMHEGDPDSAIECIKEARQWISTAMALDKAAADGVIKDLKDKIDEKLKRRDAADKLAERRRAGSDNVVPMRGT